MPTISQHKKDKISEQILAFLFQKSLEPQYTAAIAREIIRDEEFTKSLLQSLEKNKLIVRVSKNAEGIEYVKRERWRLSNTAYEVYKDHQTN